MNTLPTGYSSPASYLGKPCTTQVVIQTPMAQSLSVTGGSGGAPRSNFDSVGARVRKGSVVSLLGLHLRVLSIHKGLFTGETLIERKQMQCHTKKVRVIR